MEVAVITYDSSEIQTAYAERQGLEFPLLSDVGSEVIKRYGLLNESVDPSRQSYGIPHPGTFILDTNGRVVQRFFEQSYQPRNTVASISVKLGSPIGDTGVTGTRLTTNHLEVVAYPTDKIVAPGNRFSVVLDVTPKEGMHVYAPGNHSYQVIVLEVQPQEGAGRASGNLPGVGDLSFRAARRAGRGISGAVQADPRSDDSHHRHDSASARLQAAR